MDGLGGHGGSGLAEQSPATIIGCTPFLGLTLPTCVFFPCFCEFEQFVHYPQAPRGAAFSRLIESVHFWTANSFYPCMPSHLSLDAQAAAVGVHGHGRDATDPCQPVGILRRRGSSSDRAMGCTSLCGVMASPFGVY